MIKLEKLAELEYNELITLRLIEKDDDLCGIFREDMKLPFTMLYRMSKEGSLTDEIKNHIFQFFDKIISTKKAYISKYRQLVYESENGITPEVVEVPGPKVEETPGPVVEEPAPVAEVKTPEKPKKVVEKKFPKRYGKEAIKKDIEAQGGKATTTQLTAIALNDLKNIYGVLNTRLIKDMKSDTKALTDEEYREIRAAITILQNKLKPILKKK